MKRILSCLLCAVVLLTCTAVQLPRVSAYNELRGDCDGNDTVNAEDVYKLQKWLLGKAGMIYPQADMNGDSVINAVDLTLLKRFVLPKDETATLMVYLAGSNLESRYAEASNDLAEIQDAVLTDGLTVTAMTGGAKNWFHRQVEADANYLLTFTAEGMTSERMDGEQRPMDDPDTLRDFIKETAQAHPADHYALILWGHGAGPLFGLCHDEISGGVLTLPALRTALTEADVHFDWVGFDSCLMGTLETAYALRDCTDYMLASEDTVSKRGWEYEDFLTDWAADPSVSTVKLAELAIEHTVGNHEKADMSAMLSCWDLSQIVPLAYSYCNYIDDVYATYQWKGIEYVLRSRLDVIDYDNESYDVCDLASLVAILPESHSEVVREEIKKTIVCHRSTQPGTGEGVGIWFFERHPGDGITKLPDVYSGIGLPEETAEQLSEMCSAVLEAYSEPQ